MLLPFAVQRKEKRKSERKKESSWTYLSFSATVIDSVSGFYNRPAGETFTTGLGFNKKKKKEKKDSMSF